MVECIDIKSIKYVRLIYNNLEIILAIAASRHLSYVSRNKRQR